MRIRDVYNYMKYTELNPKKIDDGPVFIGIEENQKIDVQSNSISILPKQLKAHLGTKQLSAHSCSTKCNI